MPAPIVIKAGDMVIPATLNDTVAAQEFKKRLPFTVTGCKSEVDFCCCTACGVFDPTETQIGWKNGDISLAGGWFAILFAGEEKSSSYRGMMIIAHIEEKYLELIKGLPYSSKFIVDLEES
ncbi:hypothetical protein lbkm_0436 [Lachnospiraceae bacterium KM106-2]|nr:hypothetical protein lbkm_0436 [Lachnospiraceae bacterium KM106-2]